jgi:hypothetical protein
MRYDEPRLVWTSLTTYVCVFITAGPIMCVFYYVFITAGRCLLLQDLGPV